MSNCRRTVFARAHFSVRCVCHAPSSRSVPSIRTELLCWTARAVLGSSAVLLYASVVSNPSESVLPVDSVVFSSTLQLLACFRLSVLILSVSVCLTPTSCNSHKSPCSFSINPTWGAQQQPWCISCPRSVTNTKLVTWVQMTHWHTLQASCSAQRPSSSHEMSCCQDHSLPY